MDADPISDEDRESIPIVDSSAGSEVTARLSQKRDRASGIGSSKRVDEAMPCGHDRHAWRALVGPARNKETAQKCTDIAATRHRREIVEMRQFAQRRQFAQHS